MQLAIKAVEHEPSVTLSVLSRSTANQHLDKNDFKKFQRSVHKYYAVYSAILRMLKQYYFPIQFKHLKTCARSIDRENKCQSWFIFKKIVPCAIQRLTQPSGMKHRLSKLDRTTLIEPHLELSLAFPITYRNKQTSFLI